jgi:hypothetical protein
MKPAPFWRLWLTAVSIGMVVFGLVMVLFIQSKPLTSLTRLIDLAFWPTGDASASVAQFQTWAYAAWGATVAGFGVLTTFVAMKAFAKGEKWGRNALLAGLTTWYVLDTLASALSAVWPNVLLNTVIALLVAPPLIATWNVFEGPNKGTTAA